MRLDVPRTRQNCRGPAPIGMDVAGGAHPRYVPTHAVPDTSVKQTLPVHASLPAPARRRVLLPPLPPNSDTRVTRYVRITTHIMCRCTR